MGVHLSRAVSGAGLVAVATAFGGQAAGPAAVAAVVRPAGVTAVRAGHVTAYPGVVKRQDPPRQSCPAGLLAHGRRASGGASNA